MSMCEWKGRASYYNLPGDKKSYAAWTYEKPTPHFEKIKDYVSFYASKFDECYVNDEKVTPEAGDYYGGWITANLNSIFDHCEEPAGDPSSEAS